MMDWALVGAVGAIILAVFSAGGLISLQIRSLDSRVSGLETRFENRMSNFESRLSAVESRITRIDGLLEGYFMQTNKPEPPPQSQG